MPRTLTPGSALQIVGLKYPRLLSDGFGARFADEVQARIWLRYPWKCSLADLPPFHLVRDEPDYGPPLLAVPADFLSLQSASVVRYNGHREAPLHVSTSLNISDGTGIPEAISYQSKIASFRLSPRPSVSAPEWWIEGEYKKLPTKITNANLNSYLLPWDDLYFEVFRKGLEWKYKDEILGSQDAPQSLMLFEHLIERMAEAEDLHDGSIIVAPADPLALGG